MGRIVGIDLGTTYSAVAIPEEREGEGFYVVPKCPGCAIILDAMKSRITPSVVAEDSKGEIIVGYKAKARAGLTPEPIMFAKRYMGEDKTFQLDKQGVLRPEDAAAHVLRYLKELAESRLGEPVDEAVVTVPAYFALRAKQLTEWAGEQAGLKVRQVAPEPVAAALMYCARDARPNMRIMTYDLGGGTFDVAILEKRDGVISTNSILAFDGHRFLGGYEFDEKLALWLLDQLNGIGYQLSLDFQQQMDRVIFSKLMIYAERAKIALSHSNTYEIQDPATGITDHAGNPVNIELTVERPTFENMIRERVEETITICQRCLNEKGKEPIDPASIDEIIMIGGSSRIPLVAERLEQEFGRKPLLVEPDLCVALGAAILAGTRATVGTGALQLDKPPSETDLPSLMVTGMIVGGDEVPEVSGCAVKLSAADGSYDRTQLTDSDGKFMFEDVPLAPEAVTDFVVTARRPDGTDLSSYRFAVRHTAAGNLMEATAAPVTNLLAKPIYIKFASDLYEFAPARTPLPYERSLAARVVDASGQIRVPILDGNNILGEIIMQNIPTTLPVGSSVDLTLSVRENYQIHGRVWVPALAREATAVIDMPTPPRRELDELCADFEQLLPVAQHALASASPGMLFGEARGQRLQQRLRDCRELLQSRVPDPAKIQDCLDEITELVRQVTAGWQPQPPRAVFDAKCQEAADLLHRVIAAQPEAAQDGYDGRLEAVRKEADEAYTREDTALWRQCFERVVRICDDLESVLDRAAGHGQQQQQDPAALLIGLSRELAALERFAKDAGRYDEFKDELAELAESLQRIDPQAPDAMTRIRDWYFTKYGDLRKRLEAPTAERDLLDLA